MRVSRDKRMPSWLIGLILIVVLAVASFLAYTKELPWADKYEVKAVFESAQGVRPSSPVRIAGVNVGKVSSVEPLASAESETVEAQVSENDEEGSVTEEVADSGTEGAVVTMELQEDALPLHTDATMKLRPRLFLEGNYFVELHPGSPNAEEIDEGHTFPVNRTAYSVQLDQVLTTLQSDVRVNLQVFLDELGDALIKHGGAEGFRELYRTSAPAGKYTSQVAEAFLGTHPGDLGGVIHGLDRVVRGLGRNEATLQDLVTNFRIFAGSFAAEDAALGEAIEVLPDVLEAARPTFASLNSSFPAVRAFAREALPGVRSTPATLEAATPFVRQIRRLVSRNELRGLVADLRPTIPKLAKLATSTVDFLDEARAVASCFNEVVIPWSQDTVQPVDSPGFEYPHDPIGRVFEETGYGLSGIASESRSGDANGQYIRVLGGGGVGTPRLNNLVPSLTGGFTDALTLGGFDVLGAMPRLVDSARTPYKPNKPCERQEQPNLQGGAGQAGVEQTSLAQEPVTAAASELLEDATPQELRKAVLGAGLSPDLAQAVAKEYGTENADGGAD